MRHHFTAGIFLLALATPAVAQAPAAPLTGAQQPGARAGNAYVPSTHTPGCAGLLCDGNDPQLAAAPPPPCQGLICGVSPYSMQRPITASEAQRLQEERARASAAAPLPATPTKRVRKAKTKTRVPSAVAARTPAPAEAAQ